MLQTYVDEMGTIVVIVAFLLAASANPIDDVSHHSSGQSSDNNGHDESPSSAHEVASHAAEVTGEDIGQHDEEQDPSSSDPSVSSGDDSQQDEETAPLYDTPDVSSGNDSSNNAGDTVSSPRSPVTEISTQQSIDVDTDTRDVTQPPDGDPFDCKAPKPETHIYDICTFLCSGDMMQTAPDNSICLLNYTGNFTEKNEPTGLKENATGVCVGGTCIPKPTNSTETTGQSTTSTTTTTTPAIPETTPEPSVAGTATNPERSGPENPTNLNDSVVEIDMSQSTPSQPGPVAME